MKELTMESIKKPQL